MHSFACSESPESSWVTHCSSALAPQNDQCEHSEHDNDAHHYRDVLAQSPGTDAVCLEDRRARYPTLQPLRGEHARAVRGTSVRTADKLVAHHA